MLLCRNKDAPTLLYIDLHLVHEVTSPQAFSGLRRKVCLSARPDRTMATIDHSSPTVGLSLNLVDGMAAQQIRQFQVNCQDYDIPFYDLDDASEALSMSLDLSRG